MKYLPILFLSFFSHSILAQADIEGWMTDQLSDIIWQKTYQGELADYHPVMLFLASDGKEVAGYLVHQGDQLKHRFVGEWSESRMFQLQERDENDRLTGYLTGQIKDDQLTLKWISVNQDRIFDIQASTEKIIRISSKAPAAEWIVISSEPEATISVQKLRNGMITGFAMVEGSYIRFDGSCLDGSCSIWKASYNDPDGQEVKLLMRQKTPTTYKATINDVSYTGSLEYHSSLAMRQVDNSAGFIDFTYPELEGDAYNQWIESFWKTDTDRLEKIGSEAFAPRLAYRSSGWIEIVDETDTYVSGLVTFINPDGGQREAFLLLKKQGALIKPKELLNSPEDFSKGAELALASIDPGNDEMFYTWLEDVGYTVMMPTEKGIVMATEFNTVYGDELRLLSIQVSKSMIRKKYWKYFGW